MKPTFQPAKKALGQNFLHDQQIIQKIVDALHPKEQDVVVEIGPGRGALTEHLIKACNELHIIEYDHTLAAYWNERAEQAQCLHVHNQDVLKIDFETILPERSTNKLRVIGNLPYNISSQILIKLLDKIEITQDIVAMLQLEMVDRICASPNSKQFGRLSIMLQQAFDCQKLFKVPSGAFTPAPKVESAIIRLVPRSDDTRAIKDKALFANIVRTAFSQRRKTLHNNLKKIIGAQIYEQLDINPKLRPENLTVDQYVALANLLTEK